MGGRAVGCTRERKQANYNLQATLDVESTRHVRSKPKEHGPLVYHLKGLGSKIVAKRQWTYNAFNS